MPRSCDLVDRCGDPARVLHRYTVAESIAQPIDNILCWHFAGRGKYRTGMIQTSRSSIGSKTYQNKP